MTASQQRRPRWRALRFRTVVRQAEPVPREAVDSGRRHAAQRTAAVATEFTKAQIVDVKKRTLGLLAISRHHPFRTRVEFFDTMISVEPRSPNVRILIDREGARDLVAGHPLRLPHAGGKSGFRRRVDPLAGHRHRRQLRHLQLRRCAAAASASGRQAWRGLDRGLAIVVRGAQRKLARVLVPRLRGHPGPEPQLRRTRCLLPPHCGSCCRSLGDAEDHTWHARERQSVAADGRRARHRPRVPPGRGSGQGSRCRRHPQPRAVGAGIRVGSRSARQKHPHQRRAVHGHWRGAGVVYGDESVRARRFHRADDDVPVAHQRREGRIARGA